ncbi:response regulator [Zhouia spongiae]|uniref:Response regulator n=1 Tax=Zhouia spongiae TaxID=2202721 RepID=A0ABY3YKK9_9FLAO|nr:response regulator [Zhouia spongiae]UNY98344.1 response regulator [Zhouia spongiae]
MSTKRFHILLVDDHPLITNSYEDTICKLGVEKNVEFQVQIAHSFSNAVNDLKKKKYDLVLLDIHIPGDEATGLISGEDLGSKIRENYKSTKIIISTTFNDHYRIQSIIEQVNPDGFLVKSDITTEELKHAIWRVLTAPPYFSKTVTHSIRQFISNDFVLDKIDRKLLYHLSKGANLQTIADQLGLSRAAIAKRKQLLREVFNVDSNDNMALLEKAREKGFI